MAHFAQIIDGVVQQVIVISNNDCPDPAPDNEAQGQAFIASIGLSGDWVQTSYHGTFRYNYAGPGYVWDKDNDAFYAPQPYPSWTLDANYQWQPPLPYPTDGDYTWDEGSQQWVKLKQ